MRFFSKINIFLLSILLCSFSAYPQQPTPDNPVNKVYAVKPEWWDKVNIRFPTNKINDAATFWSVISATNTVKASKLEGWKVIGPFNNEVRDNFAEFSKICANPEQSPLKANDGKDHTWQDVAPGKPWPVPNNVGNLTIAGYKTIDQPAATASYMIISANADVMLNVNGDEYNIEAGESVVQPVSFKAGKNIVFFATRFSPQAFRLEISTSSVHPNWNDIKLNSAQYNAFCGTNNDSDVATAGNLVRLYGIIGDEKNFGFWVNRSLEHIVKTKIPASLYSSTIYHAQLFAKKTNLLKVLFSTANNFASTITDKDMKYQLAAGLMYLSAGYMKDSEALYAARIISDIQPTYEQISMSLSMYMQSSETNHLGIWVHELLMEKTGRARQDLPSWFVNNFAQFNNKQISIVLSCIEKDFGSITNIGSKKVTANYYINQTLSRGDIVKAKQFLPVALKELAGTAEFDKNLWRLKTALMDNDEETARDAVKAIKADTNNAVFVASPEFNAIEYSLAKMSTAMALPVSLDLSFDTISASIKRLAKNEETEALHEAIRNILIEKSASVEQDSKDKNLFNGSKSKYRELFESYKDDYKEALDDYVKQLAKSTAQGKAVASQIEKIAGIEMPASGEKQKRNLLSASQISDTALKEFDAIVEIPYGGYEAGIMNNMEIDTPPSISCFEDKDSFIFQNSRGVICTKGNKLVWSSILPIPGSDTSGISSLFMSDTFKPAVVRNIVATKILDRNSIIISGVNKNTGRALWRRSITKEYITSGIASWQSSFVFLINKPNDAGVNTELWVIDSATGDTQFQIPLASGANSFYLADWQVSLSVKGLLPPPSIDGDCAYFETGLGAIGAVNLQDQSLMWLRSYPQLRISENSFKGRYVMSPAIGTDNALFAPADTAWIFLVNKQTGALVSSITDTKCISSGLAGGNTGVITTPSSVIFISLKDMQMIHETALPNAIFMKQLEDGCMIALKGKIVCFDEKGNELKTIKLPAGTYPVTYNGNDLMVCGGQEQTLLGTASNAKGDKSYVKPAVKEKSYEIKKPTAVTLSTGTLFFESNRMTLMDNKENILWERATPNFVEKSIRDDDIIVTFAGRTRLIDSKTGAVKGVKPNSSDAPNTRFASAVFGNTGVFALQNIPPDRNLIYKFNPDDFNSKAELIGEVTGTPMMRDFTAYWAVFETNERYYLLLGRPNECIASTYTINKNDSKKIFTCTDATQRGRIWVSRDAKSVKLFNIWDPKKNIFTLSGNSLTSKEFKPIANTVSIEVSGNIVALRSNNNDMQFIDTVSENFITLPAGETRCYGVFGSTIYWLKGKDKTLSPYTVDLRNSMQPVQGRDVTLYSKDFAPAGNGLIGSSNYVLFLWWDSRGVAVVWDKEKTYASQAPLYTRDDTAITRYESGNYSCFRSQIMTAESIQKCINLNEKVMDFTKNNITNFQPVIVDGFLDEWNETDFIKTPKGKYSLRHNNRGDMSATFFVGIEVTDPDLIKRISAAGMDNRTFWVCRSGGQQIYIDSILDLPTAINTSKTNQNYCFAYSITPDGKKCQIEISTTIQIGTPVKKKLAFEKTNDMTADFVRDSGRQYFGDCAFKLLWRNDLNILENILEPEIPAALSFERFLLNP